MIESVVVKLLICFIDFTSVLSVTFVWCEKGWKDFILQRQEPFAEPLSKVKCNDGYSIHLHSSIQPHWHGYLKASSGPKSLHLVVSFKVVK